MPRWYLVLAALVGIGIPAAWLLSVITPGEEAVKVRNALVARIGTPQDFNWSPDNAPPGFQSNRAAPTAQFVETAQSLAVTGTGDSRRGFELALEISRHLMGTREKRAGGPIRGSLADAYRGVIGEGRGYCADFTQVFTGLALGANLPVRTWSISFEAFGAGHTFNEIYDEDLRKWIMVDSFHSLYFVDPTTREPLSVLELHDRLMSLDGESRGVLLQPIVADRLPFRSEQAATEYYRRGMTQLALVWGNNVFDYDQSNAVRMAARVSRHLERAVGIWTGHYPELLIYPNALSHRDVDSLFRARDRFLAAMGCLLLASLVFGGLLLSAWRRPIARGDRQVIST